MAEIELPFKAGDVIQVFEDDDRPQFVKIHSIRDDDMVRASTADESWVLVEKSSLVEFYTRHVDRLTALVLFGKTEDE